MMQKDIIRNIYLIGEIETVAERIEGIHSV